MKTIQPRKQRKKMYQAPQHIRYKRFSAPLSSALKSSHNINSIPVRTGDTVRIMRGNYKGFEGKVSRVDRKKYRIFIEGVSREKVDGSTVLVPIHPSKVMITQLNLDDKWRKEILKRKGGVSEKAELAEEKPIEEAKPEPPKKKPKRKKKTRKKATAESGGT
ncbi:50S ribosomal protein L24 [Candidatus Bathyarchaeota archaeon]|nr:MAG: 50S ribosomal protein L24 [Candidatus Bathyarchaeota archaeon]